MLNRICERLLCLGFRRIVEHEPRAKFTPNIFLCGDVLSLPPSK